MSQENQSSLRFSLEESLWFRKGQEVEELVSISLDPDITIQENDQYVTIRGSLELTGEYKSSDNGEENADEGIASQKFVETVSAREEGQCEFSHRFPVDITIPNNRVKSIYDIDVLVESFDYSLPERSCLKLSAELTISGLHGSELEVKEPELQESFRSQAPKEQASSEPNLAESSLDNNLLFETEARKQQEEPAEDFFPKFPTFNYQPSEVEQQNFEPALHLQEARSEGTAKEEVVIEEQIVVEEEAPEVVVETKEVHEEESSSSSSSDPKLFKKGLFKKKSMSLTEFFARKDESSAQVKLKVCIVQKGDTLESLADRYDVTVQNLQRVNRLEINQDVYEGQVLYIPHALAKK